MLDRITALPPAFFMLGNFLVAVAVRILANFAMHDFHTSKKTSIAKGLASIVGLPCLISATGIMFFAGRPRAQLHFRTFF